ncbi:FAD:protein FMN transferase [Thalassospiraceae bacterium LMO-SO8]|nr:FAD:protein FMN transferase [Alphaproteobacteria bacterium LMO-S08]WND74711.1 FAD:protein FMN transferase [Thalassospiraceae bacterium LMO-SO8]
MTDALRSPDRRRCITVLAGAFAGAVIGGRKASAESFEWRGTALGADARIILSHPSRAAAKAAVLMAKDEIDRLENILSLYRPGSALSQLNKKAGIDPAPLELMDVLRRSLWYTEITNGAFDISIQPIWDLYARHFRTHGSAGSGPAPKDIQDALSKVGAHRIHLTSAGVSMAPGTGLTLNGIAQGYITDRVADLLREQGWRNVLVDLGEFHAVGGRADGHPWKIKLPGGGLLDMADGALATSSADGMRFSPEVHHIFDPGTGVSAKEPMPVTVRARRAVDADALSTSLSVCDRSDWARILARVPGSKVV